MRLLSHLNAAGLVIVMGLGLFEPVMAISGELPGNVLSDEDADTLANQDQIIGLRCLQGGWSEEPSPDCRDWENIQEQLQVGGYCRRILASSTDEYVSKWSQCWGEAANYADVRNDIKRFQDLSRACRASAEETPPGVCDQASAASHAVEEAGWCYGRIDEIGAFGAWHACEPDSVGGIKAILNLAHNLRTWSDADQIESSVNLLESQLDVPLFLGLGSNQQTIGRLSVTCGKVDAPSLDLALYDARRFLNITTDAGAHSGLLPVTVGAAVDSATPVTAILNSSDGTFGLTIDDKEVFQSVLLSLYREGTIRISIPQGEEARGHSLSIRIGGDRTSRSQIANMTAICLSL